MPLSPTIQRQLLHTRKVTCEGYLRDDGLIDIEGHMVDTKPFEFPNKDRGGSIKPGEALHGMSIRITIDRDMLIKDAAAVMDFTPYNYCKSISGVFTKLIGIQIGPGWRGKIRDIMGGTKGCTHITELLGPVATTAFQTLVSLEGPDGESSDNGNQLTQPSKFINSCHSYAETSPVVKEFWPQVFQQAQHKKS